jgi:hypothetical protein
MDFAFQAKALMRLFRLSGNLALESGICVDDVPEFHHNLVSLPTQ